jgi:hypothetical protein
MAPPAAAIGSQGGARVIAGSGSRRRIARGKSAFIRASAAA